MLSSLLLLSLVPFGCPLIINPRQNLNGSSLTPAIGTGTGFESASSCIQSKYSWAKDNGTKFAYSTVSITSNTYADIDNLVDYKTVTSLDKNATAYTLCDKWPRLDGTTSIIEHSYQRITNWTSSYIATVSVSTAYPAPNCTILKPECDILHASYASATSSFSAAWSAYESDYSSARSAGVTPTVSFPKADYTSPICGSPTPFRSTSAVGPPGCAVDKATVQLLYWPVTRQAGDLCNSNASLATMGPTIPGKPNTAVYDGTTLTSPTVYIALDGTWRVTSSGTTIDEHSRLILPKSPMDVSSVCGPISGGNYSTYAVNYADFNGDVPASAYRCQPRCNTNTFSPVWTNTSIVYSGFTLGDVTVPESTRTYMRYDWDKSRDGYPSENLCSTIWDDYRPALAIPAEFSSMNPAQNMSGNHCEFIFGDDSIFYDPPIALGEKASIIVPTMPGPTSPDPAVTAKPTPTPDPGSVPKPTTPSATKLPSVETDPPVVPEDSSQQPDPVTKTTDGAGESSQLPGSGTDKANAPTEPSQGPDSGTEKPSAPGDPSQLPDSGTGIANVPKPSHQPSNGPPGSGDTKTSPHNAGDTEQATTGQALTKPDATHTSQPGVAPIGAVVTASNGQQISVIQSRSDGPIVVGTVTLTQGQSTGIDGVGQVIAGSSGLSVGDTYHTFTPVGPAATSGVILTDSAGDGVTVEPGSDAGDVVIGSSTLAIGALIMAGLGSVAAGTEGVVADGTSATLGSLDPTSTNSAYVVAGITFTAHATSAISLSPDVTLVPGGPVVSIDGSVVSLAPSGAYVVVDGTTQHPTPVATPAPSLEIGGTTYTANQASGFVVDGATLTRGGAVVADGTTISLDASGGYVVVNGVTQSVSAPFATATSTSDRDAGEIATDSNNGESATESNAGESVTESSSASGSDGQPSQASSACSFANDQLWVNVLVTLMGVFFLF